MYSNACESVRACVCVSAREREKEKRGHLSLDVCCKIHDAQKLFCLHGGHLRRRKDNGCGVDKRTMAKKENEGPVYDVLLLLKCLCFVCDALELCTLPSADVYYDALEKNDDDEQ